MKTCECCATKGGTEIVGRLYDGARVRQVRSVLCGACAGADHSLGRCRATGCGQLVWQCARVAHVALRHPVIVQHRENAPEAPAYRPRLRYLGRLPYPLDGPLPVPPKRTHRGGAPGEV